MNKPARRSRLRLVGGPGDTRSAPYVERDADQALQRAVLDGEHAHVLAAAHRGKTSLVLRAAARWREAGCRVACVDLADLGSRNVAQDPGRWYYSFAWRVVRELRIRPDLNAWWQDRGNLTVRQRLRDFFLEVVLASTREPVVVIVDQLDAVIEQRAAWEIFDAIRACHDARANDPECRRLAFVLVGEPGAERVLSQRGSSPFEVSRAIALPDFELAEVHRLARQLLPERGAASTAAVDRVWHWTGGLPWLTAKLLAAVAGAAGGGLDEAAIDAAVARRLASRSATRDDPHLARLAARVLRSTPLRDPRLTLIGKVAKGIAVPTDPLRYEQRDLLEWGLLTDEEGQLAFRNRIYGAVFTALWANRNLPITVRSVAVVVACLLALALVPVLYTEYLPRPYQRTLAAADSDYESATRAWRRLGLLPGFGVTADNLYARYLEARGERATRLAEVERLSARLASLPNRAPVAERLRSAFWDRRANAMARRGDRDGAVLYALEAMGTPTRERRQRLQEYLDPGLARLLGTIRPPATLTGVEADAVSGLITLLDSQHEITVWRPGSAAGEAPQRQQRLRLAASTERRQRSVLGPGGRRALLWPLDAAAGDAVEVWDVGTARVVARLAQPPGLQSAAFVLGQDAVLLSAAPELRLHDARSGRLLARLPDALLAGERVLKAVNGRYLGWRQADGGYAVFDVARMRLAGTLPAVGDSAPVALDPLGQLVAVAVPPDVVSVRAVPSGAELARCQLTARAIALDFDPQGRWLVVQSDDGRLTLHEPTPGCPLRLQREGPRRWHAAFSLDSEYLLVGNLARGYELVTTGTGVRLGAPFQPGMGGAGALPGGTASLPRLIAPLGLALTYDGRKAVKLWSLVAPDDPAGRQPPPAAQIAIAADGRRAVRAGMAGELQFLDVPDSGDLRPPAVRSGAGALQTARHGAPVTRLAFDDRGRRLASGGLDGSLRLWNATRGEPVGASARHDDGAVIALHFLPGGRWLASATARSVQVLDTETATVIARLPVAARTPSLLVGPDGVLYIGGDGEGVTRWDWRTGTATALVAANYRVRTATLSRDGQWLATAGADRIVRLWRLGSTAPLPQTHTVPAMVEALTFSVDGRRLWLKSGAWLTVLDRNASGLSAPVTRSLPDADSQLVAALPDGAIRLLLRPAGSRPQLWSRRADEPWLDAGRSVAVVDPAEPPARLRLQVGENGTLVPIGQD